MFSIIVKKVERTSEDVYTETPTFKFIVGEDGRILCSGNSIKESYRDYIDRYAATTIVDVAELEIETVSLTKSVTEVAAETIINTAPYVNHKG